MIKQRLAQLVGSALERASADGVIADGSVVPEFERPRRAEHGDWATNVALAVAKGAASPRVVAQALVERLPASDLVERVEIAGPGFINFHLAPAWLHDVVRRAADPRSGFGRTDLGGALEVNLEYVSSNPTGPISVVSGRHAAVGDALGNLLEATGHRVTREFFVNDAGRQADLFARSVEARYLQRFDVAAELPEAGYRGGYVVDLAEEIAQEVGRRLVEAEPDERLAELRAVAVSKMTDAMRRSLDRFGTRYEVWRSESDLHSGGLVGEALDRLREAGYLEEREGALWFRSSALGDDKDRVIVKADGEPTYLAADAGYLLDKLRRGFEHLVYLWGADHHGTVARLLAVSEALGFSREVVEVRLVQIVTFAREGEEVKGSKRAGVIVELDELVDEVGADAARYTFLTRSIDAPLVFDIELVKEQAPENPVYYVQYAHARICSILRKAEQEGVRPGPDAPLDALGHPSEEALMRKLAAYEEVLPDAAAARAPQKLTRYVEELASDFSAFYRDCRVVTEDEALTAARLALCVATKNVIADALALLGVTAPERM